MDPNNVRLLQRFLPALVQPPPDATGYFEILCSAIVDIVQYPPYPLLSVHDRLFSNAANMYEGRDVFSTFSRHRAHFYEMTGETPETLIQLVNLVDLEANREHSLNALNRVLLIMVWIRSYPRYCMLSSIFGISKSTVKREIKTAMPHFERKLKGFIQWPSVADWQSHRGVWEKIKPAVGAIDGTSHQIYRPSVEPQEQYFSGHRYYHAIHTQVVVDTTGYIRYVESGFLGHQNDAQQFGLMRQIGRDLPFPDDCVLLGDKVYPNRYPPMTAYSATQLARKHGRHRRQCQKFNRYVRKYRVCVEHAIAKLKSYRSIASIRRHPRDLLPSVVHVCACLVCRRKEMGLKI